VYTRPRLNLAHYIPLPRKIVFALGADAAYIQTLGNYSVLPNDVKFVTGGANSLRGYGYNLVGVAQPDNPLCSADTPTACVRGGAVMLVGHAELRVPVWGELGAVVFSDVGNVWDTPASVSLGGVKVTAGMGVRYQTPLGPIRADYGFRVRPYFEFGRDFYFGLGQAF
jgi:outer membrane translocation and assembly module TamA